MLNTGSSRGRASMSSSSMSLNRGSEGQQDQAHPAVAGACKPSGGPGRALETGQGLRSGEGRPGRKPEPPEETDAGAEGDAEPVRGWRRGHGLPATATRPSCFSARVWASGLRGLVGGHRCGARGRHGEGRVSALHAHPHLDPEAGSASRA